MMGSSGDRIHPGGGTHHSDDMILHTGDTTLHSEDQIQAEEEEE